MEKTETKPLFATRKLVLTALLACLSFVLCTFVYFPAMAPFQHFVDVLAAVQELLCVLQSHRALIRAYRREPHRLRRERLGLSARHWDYPVEHEIKAQPLHLGLRREIIVRNAV